MKQIIMKWIEKYRTFILYMLFGIPPTAISFGGYLVLIEWVGLPAFLANGIAWCAALIVSFSLYRRYVFHSKVSHRIDIFHEFWKFTLLRLFSGILETGLVWLFVDLLHGNATIFKVAASLLAAFTNYIVSKVIIFSHKHHHSDTH